MFNLMSKKIIKILRYKMSLSGSMIMIVINYGSYISAHVLLFVCLFVLKVPLSAKFIWRWQHSLKSHQTD